MAEDPSPELPDDLRRLLADARHSEPIPVDVAARLDGVLARLEEERSAHPEGGVEAGIVDLAARRRRLRAVRLLGAAAAVIVVGTAAVQALDLGSGADEAASSSVSADDRSSTAPDTGGDSGREDQPGVDPNGGTAELGSALDAPAAAGSAMPQDRTVTGTAVAGIPARLTRLDDLGFSDQVEALRERVQTGYAADDSQTLKRLDGCAPADWGDGTAVAVTYNGDPAVLVFRPPTGATQVVDLLQCGTGDVLRSTTVRVG